MKARAALRQGEVVTSRVALSVTDRVVGSSTRPSRVLHRVHRDDLSPFSTQMARGSNTRFRGGSSSYRGSSFRGSSSYRGSYRGRGRGGSSNTGGASGPAPARDDEGTALAERFERTALEDEIDEKMGFARVSEGARREGWLINMHPVRPFPYARSI